jgi:O-antigen/teichoic acid export membrane protein
LNPLKKLLGQTAVYGLSSILGRTLNYLLVPFYLLYFKDPSDYGVVSQLYAFVAFLMVFLTFGMETAYFRFIQNEEDKPHVFSTGFIAIMLVNSIFMVSLFLFNQNLANFLLVGENTEYIVMMGAIVVIDAISALPLAKLRAEENAKKFALIQFSSIGANILLNIILFVGFFDEQRPEEGVFFILIANLLSSLVKPAFLYKDFIGFKLTFHWDLFKRMIIYGFPILIGGFAGIVNETIDRILLKQILYNPAVENSADYANHEIGVYSACYKLAMLVTILLQAYRYAAEPFFFNQMKDQDRNKTYIKLMNYFVAAMCLVFLLISLNLDIFKYFITNENYWKGLRVVPILLLANVFLGIYYNQSIWYKLSNQTKFGAYIAIIGAIVTILINVIFIPEYGYMASAWATLIVYALQMVLSYWLGQKYYPIKYNRRKFVLYLGSALLIYFIVSRIPFGDHGFIRFAFSNLFVLIFIWIVVTIEGISVRQLIRRK